MLLPSELKNHPHIKKSLRSLKTLAFVCSLVLLLISCSESAGPPEPAEPIPELSGVDFTLTVLEDTPTKLTLRSSGATTDNLSYNVLFIDGSGSLTGDAPDLIYTPEDNFFGTEYIVYEVSDGVSTSEAAEVTLKVTNVDDEAQVIIDHPAKDENLEYGKNTLLARAFDFDTGDLTDQITWASNVDGDLGDGKDVELSMGEHMLTASVTVDGATTTADIATSVVGYTFDDDVEIRSQADIDRLENVGTISGSLYIAAEEAVLDFTPLEHLSVIRDDFFMSKLSKLVSLTGFNNLEEVRGRFFIYGTINKSTDTLKEIDGFRKLETVWGTFAIFHNASLESVQGFDNLEDVGAFSIDGNKSLVSLPEFAKALKIRNFIQIQNNETLGQFRGFDNLETVGTAIDFDNNRMLERIEGFSELRSTGFLFRIEDNSSLTDIPAFNKLGGLTSELRIGKKEQFIIRNNPVLEKISGFDSLTNVEELIIRDNRSLASVSGFDSLAIIDGFLSIDDNEYLNTISGFNNLDSDAGYTSVDNNPALDCPAQNLSFTPLDSSKDNLRNCLIK